MTKPILITGAGHHARLAAIASMLLLAPRSCVGSDSIATIIKARQTPPEDRMIYLRKFDSVIYDEVPVIDQYKRWPGDTRNEAGSYINRKKKKRK